MLTIAIVRLPGPRTLPSGLLESGLLCYIVGTGQVTACYWDRDTAPVCYRRGQPCTLPHHS